MILDIVHVYRIKDNFQLEISVETEKDRMLVFALQVDSNCDIVETDFIKKVKNTDEMKDIQAFIKSKRLEIITGIYG